MSTRPADPTSSPLTRRFFLRGAGGAALAIPVMGSLLSAKEARAQAMLNNRCFVGLVTEYGGVWSENMFPSQSTLTNTLSYGTVGFNVRSGPLAAAVNNGVASLSPCLSASSAVLTPKLVSKMNVLRGLDITYPIAHHYGEAALGNLSKNSSGSNPLANQDRRSIDQVMAWSPNFYQSQTAFTQRSICMWQAAVISYGYSNPAAGTGTIDGVGTVYDQLDMFSALFPSPPAMGPTPRAPIVDRILDSYNRLRYGNKRLSALDKQRLDDHIQRIYELQRKLQAATASSCNSISRPTASNRDLQASNYDGNPAKNVQFFQMYNDVIVAGLHCGATRIVTLCGDAYSNTFSTVPTAIWHEGISHHTNSVNLTQAGAVSGQTMDAQQTMVAAQQQFFAGVMLDLAQKLDAALEPDGSSTLDRTLMTWMQEHGNFPHDAYSIPVVTMGSAAGNMKTGNFNDYRNVNHLVFPGDPDPQRAAQNSGLTWHQLLGSALQIVGVHRSEYQEPQHNGYGAYISDPASDWPQATWNAAGDILPFL
jgi:hypothetical protein